MVTAEAGPQLEIRPAREDDAAALRDIFNEALQDGMATFETEPRSVEEQRQRLAEAARGAQSVLVAQLGQWVLGCITVEQSDSRPALEGVGEVTVFVRRSFRKHGVGKQLMLAIQQEARRRGYRKLTGFVLAENTDSLRLCRVTGWREAGRLEKHVRIGGALHDVVLVEYLVP